MLYGFFRGLSWLSLHIFFKKICLVGRENTRFDAPAIVVSNHPNTLMDPLCVGIHVPQQMFFLANYGLFKNPISNWVFRRLFAIPVKRREDVPEGEARNNDEAFEACFEHLKIGGTLFACPEGTSWMQRWVRPLKTGAARIAFGAETRNGWSLGVKIIPVGLDYSAPREFRSRVAVHFGQPILVENWRSDFEKDPVAAVENLTQHIHFQLKNLCVDCRDEAGEAQVRQLENFLEVEKIGDCQAQFFQSKKIAAQVTPTSRLALPASLPGGWRYSFAQPEDWRYLLAPFAFLGYAFWGLPCLLPFLIEKKLKLYVGYGSTVKMLAGILTFSWAMIGAFLVLKNWSGSAAVAIGGVVGLVAAGFAAAHFSDFLKEKKAWRQAQNFQKKQPAEHEKLVALRRSILEQLG